MTTCHKARPGINPHFKESTVFIGGTRSIKYFLDLKKLKMIDLTDLSLRVLPALSGRRSYAGLF